MRSRVAKEKLSKGAASGMVALVFLVLGFQIAVFVIKVIERPAETTVPEDGGSVVLQEEGVVGQSAGEGDRPVGSGGPSAGRSGSGKPGGRRAATVSEGGGVTRFGGYAAPANGRSGASASARPRRSVESFAFDPNTVSLGDLQRLGLSERQAESIENYRSKGGKFRSKEDFKKMYVVSDTLYARLEPFIEIARLELNSADSAALVTLKGIGPYYARKIIAYRERLGGFVDEDQLMEIEGIDSERFEGLAPQVTVDSTAVRRLDIWHAGDSVLARHPYLGPRGSRSIIRYRSLYDSARWTLRDLASERVLPQENIEKLKKYIANQ
ncbi:MAG: helix-hairpin-helix domain-containing protein [Bacteroidales bacterium]|nr:helix-hairpin-helix domain-containing protein [Bacteroidales bacterium]